MHLGPLFTAMGDQMGHHLELKCEKCWRVMEASADVPAPGLVCDACERLKDDWDWLVWLFNEDAPAPAGVQHAIGLAD